MAAWRALQRRPLLLAVVGCLALPADALRNAWSAVSGRDVVKKLRQYSFNDFVRQFERSYQPGSEEWNHREKVFYKRLGEVINFNLGPPRSWAMGITKFMDYTDSEFKAILGYRGRRKRVASSLLAVERHEASTIRHQEPLPLSVNTLQAYSKLGLIIRDQGGCGSCWAEAAISVLEARMESDFNMTRILAEKMRAMGKKVLMPTLSTQTVVSCAPNPHHCGGTGACGGATAELAFELIKDKGVPLAVTWPYKSAGGTAPACNYNVFDEVVLGIKGYTVLPSNKLEPLKRALVETGGPLAITAAASKWAYYDHGIFSDPSGGESADFTVNHAVTLVGYQDPTPTTMGYWVVKNSWGEAWGENGYIRIEMKANEEAHCGWDYNPKEGIACDGDPDKAWVCGTCGILYDSAYPTGIHLRGR